MPFSSQAQRGLFYATAAGAKTGVPMKVAKEFIASDHPGKLPQHVRHAFGGGIKHPTVMHIDVPGSFKLSGSGGGASPMGGQKSIGASQRSPWWTRSESRMDTSPEHTGFAVGGNPGMGARTRLQDGGMSFSEENPWWERSEARQADIPFHGGLISSSGAGRTDRLPLAVAAESHVLPSDVVSGTGSGNTLAGARILMAAMRTGPYGTTLPHEVQGHTIPRPPSPPAGEIGQLAKGGASHKVGILAAGGELVVPPEDWLAHDPDDNKLYWHRGVRSLGGGDLNKGHRVLDDMIRRVREFNIKFLKTAPPPKK